jgi:hypothetical protein
VTNRRIVAMILASTIMRHGLRLYSHGRGLFHQVTYPPGNRSGVVTGWHRRGVLFVVGLASLMSIRRILVSVGSGFSGLIT